MGGRAKRSSHFQHTIIDLIITFSVQELCSCTEKLSGHYCKEFSVTLPGCLKIEVPAPKCRSVQP